MTSIRDCAALAADVYDRTGNSVATSAGWMRLDGQNWTYGFAAGRYQKANEHVVAFRGTDTDDSVDLLSDAVMVPMTEPGAARLAFQTLFRQYGVDNLSVAALVAPQLAESLVQFQPVATVIERHANQVPTEQLRQALAYFDSCQPRPRFITGHSLGGALAQLVAHERGVPAIAFNSPFMGTLRGAMPASSQLILQINTVGDPLSLATQSVGNLPHGRVITVSIPPRHQPPQMQRRPRGFLDVVAPAAAMAYREAEAQAQYHRQLLGYVGEAMLYYHSMGELLLAILREPRFAMPLLDDLTNV